MLGRRFIFGVVAIVCVSGVAVYLHYDGETYFKLVGSIVGIFMIAQTTTDLKK